ncbi:MAG: NAD(P)-dependent oxidoreductase [Candidatus Brocadiales bacterium]
MNIAVVGGSGFIGNFLIEELLSAGHRVVNFDIQHPKSTKVTHVYVDVTDFSKLAVAMAGQWDAVYLMAAVANVDHFFVNPVEAYRVNMDSVINVLEVARRYNVPRVLYASTVWVYELADGSDVDETTPLTLQNVNHLYTVTKLAGEMSAISYNRLYGQEYTVLRFGIPYGPGARMGTVITEFVRRAMTNEPLVIHGDGSQSRYFIHVKDLAQGCVAALQPKAANQVYNLEGRQEVTIREIAEIVQQEIPNTVIEQVEARKGDFTARKISYNKAKNELGWEPRMDFRKGLTDYIRWYRENVSK